MSDHLFYPLAALVALAMIALALAWPQGTGVRSPPPFGHPVAAISSRAVAATPASK